MFEPFASTDAPSNVETPVIGCPEFFMYCCVAGFPCLPLLATSFFLLFTFCCFKLAMYAFLYAGLSILYTYTLFLYIYFNFIGN